MWYKLVMLCNNSGWQEEIVVDNNTLAAEIKSTEKTAIKHRQILIDANLIEFVQGGKGHPNKYKIIPIYETLYCKNYSTNYSTNVAESTGDTTGIYKQDLNSNENYLFNDGDDARADESGISEDITQLKETLHNIEALPVNIKTIFQKLCDEVFLTYFQKKVSDYEKAIMYDILSFFHRKQGEPMPPFNISDDDKKLTVHAFEAAAAADSRNVNYIKGVFKKYRERGIYTDDEYFEDQCERDTNRKPSGNKVKRT